MTKFSDSRHCRISKTLLTMLGMWPNQNPFEQKLKSSFIFVSLVFAFATQVLKMLYSFENFEIVVEGIAPMSVMASSSVKIYTFYKNRHQLKSLLNEADINCNSLRDDREVEILENSMKIGTLHATIYIVYIYTTLVLFVALVFQPYILDIVLPLNESRPLKSVYPAEYFFLNERDHFSIITCHSIFICWLAAAVLTAGDSLYIIYVRYGCSLFSIVGHRFELTMYEDNIDWFPIKQEQKNSNRMAIIVPTHNQAIKYFQQLESVFALPCLMQVGISLICLIFALLEALILIGKLEMIRFVFFAGGSLIHLFCYCYQGQLVIDETHQTAYKIYNGPWYNSPMEIQKALLFVQTRFSRLSYMTAGKFIILSIENFSSLVKSCTSYFTVLASFR